MQKLTPDKKKTIATLVFQFEHNIALVAIKGTTFRRLNNEGNMTKEYAIRGSYETVFFAERDIDRTAVWMLSFHRKAMKKVDKRKVFLLNCRLIAMERDGDQAAF